MKLKEIPIKELKISRTNMRSGAKAPDVSDILESIRQNGILQSVLVRKEGKRYGVVAGRRRLFASRIIAKETGKVVKLPCIVLESGDNAKAIEASLMENLGRLPTTEIEQFSAFGSLSKQGRSVDEIATHFGVTPLKVNRILALSKLKSELLHLYGDDKINVPTIRALTLASEDKQTEWLTMYHDEDAREPNGASLKSWLTGGEKISVDQALFDVSKYDGIIISDLFEEDGYFQDPDMFWKSQSVKIAEIIKDHKEDGWQDVVVLDKGETFYDWQHTKRSKAANGKVFIEVEDTGLVTIFAGYLSNEDAKKIDAILSGETEQGQGASKIVKPEMSGPLKEYVGLHRLAMAQAELLANPKTALRLTVAHMIVATGHWNTQAHRMSLGTKDDTKTSVQTSKCHERFEVERRAIYKLLGIDGCKHALVGQNRDETPCAELCLKLLDLTDKQVMRVMTFAMAESLHIHSLSVDAIGNVLEIDAHKHWSPDAAFFEILRDKRVINAMVGEIAGKNEASYYLTETGKKQKILIQNCIAGIGREEPDTKWRPRWMGFPASGYLDAQDAAPAIASREVAQLVEQQQTDKKVVPIKKVA